MKLSSKCECQDHMRWKRPKPERVEEAIGPTSYQEKSWSGACGGFDLIPTNGFTGACGASIPHQKPEIINSYGTTGAFGSFPRPGVTGPTGPTEPITEKEIVNEVVNWIQAHKEKAKVDTTIDAATISGTTGGWVSVNGWVPLNDGYGYIANFVKVGSK